MPPPGDGTYLNTIERNGRAIRYLRISAGPQRGRYVHQLVAEALLGRPLAPDEEVDHDDGDTLNTTWTNLVVRTKHDHGQKTRRQVVQRREAAATYEEHREAERAEGYTPEVEDD